MTNSFILFMKSIMIRGGQNTRSNSTRPEKGRVRVGSDYYGNPIRWESANQIGLWSGRFKPDLIRIPDRVSQKKKIHSHITLYTLLYTLQFTHYTIHTHTAHQTQTTKGKPSQLTTHKYSQQFTQSHTLWNTQTTHRTEPICCECCRNQRPEVWL